VAPVVSFSEQQAGHMHSTWRKRNAAAKRARSRSCESSASRPIDKASALERITTRYGASTLSRATAPPSSCTACSSASSRRGRRWRFTEEGRFQKASIVDDRVASARQQWWLGQYNRCSSAKSAAADPIIPDSIASRSSSSAASASARRLP
jgi:hypothetical protein